MQILIYQHTLTYTQIQHDFKEIQRNISHNQDMLAYKKILDSTTNKFEPKEYYYKTKYIKI